MTPTVGVFLIAEDGCAPEIVRRPVLSSGGTAMHNAALAVAEERDPWAAEVVCGFAVPSHVEGEIRIEGHGGSAASGPVTVFAIMRDKESGNVSRLIGALENDAPATVARSRARLSFESRMSGGPEVIAMITVPERYAHLVKTRVYAQTVRRHLAALAAIARGQTDGAGAFS